MLQKVKILFLLIFLCLVSGDLYARRYTIEQYIDSFAPVDMNLKKQTGIPASVILGVAIV
jgi:Ni,Fe-hydrogenase III small subunit